MLPTPSKATLDRYGMGHGPYALDPDPVVDWQLLAGEFCRICTKGWDLVKPVTDHRHVKGWKIMLPEARRKYVRGVICGACNHWVLTRIMTAPKALNASRYLADYTAWITQVEEAAA